MRLFYIDLVKAFAIFLVVLGHIIFVYNPGGLNESFIGIWIYSFHMPLFFILSGLFFGSMLSKDSYCAFGKK